MAYNSIWAITQTPDKAMAYGESDKVKLLKNDGQDALGYIERDKAGNAVIYPTTSSYQHCSRNNPLKDFEALRKKADGGKRNAKPQTKNGEEVLMWHNVQTFEESPQEMSVELAQLIGRRMAAEVFENFACVVSTHTNTGHLHNHFMISAWGLDGKKYNDCLATKRKIREVSDRLCREYGLHVCEHTAEMKMVKWKDKEGKTHFYEPTERKNTIRQDHQFANANDYRNTEAYLIASGNIRSNKETIKRDIDCLLPSVTSYGDLLQRLRQIGYDIKDKKKNGDWRTHITFKAPTQEKGTRDSGITDDGYYTRSNLTAVIEANVKLRNQHPVQEEKKTTYRSRLPVWVSEVEQLDPAQLELSPTGEVDKALLQDLQQIYADIDRRFGVDTIAKHGTASEKAYRKRTPKLTGERKAYLVECINADLRALHFVEEKKITSNAQIQDMVTALSENVTVKRGELHHFEAYLEELQQRFAVIGKLEEVSARILRYQEDTEYRTVEMDADSSLQQTYLALVKKYGLDKPETVEKMKGYIAGLEEKCAKARSALDDFSGKLQEYIDCVETLRRIERETEKEGIHNTKLHEDTLVKSEEER